MLTFTFRDLTADHEVDFKSALRPRNDNGGRGIECDAPCFHLASEG